MTSFKRNFQRLTWAGAVALVLSLHVRSVAAQSQDEAAARTLFIEGRQLLKQGHLEEACGKFEAARRFSSSAGLLLNLADCHERINRTASAWAEFGAAADAAASAGRAGDEAEARRRQAAVQLELSMLSIVVGDPAGDQVVTRDGAPIERSAWGTGIPVDPGTHQVTAEAAGRKAWSITVEVREPGQTVTVQVPSLVLLKQAAASTTPAAATGPLEPESESKSKSDPGHGQRVAGWVIGGVGLLSFASSGVLALVAKSRFHEAERQSGPDRHSESVSAASLADAATVAFLAGSALTVTGVIVWASAPKAHLTVGTAGPNLFVAGEF